MKRLLAWPIELLSLLKKDYMLLFRRRKYLYLALSFPLLLSLIYIFMISPNVPVAEIGVCDYDGTAETQMLADSVAGFNINILERAGCTDKLIEAIKNEEYLFGIIIDKGFTDSLNNYQQAYINVYHDNSDLTLSNFLSWKVDVALQQYKSEIIKSSAQGLKDKVTSIDKSLDVALKVVDLSGSKFIAVEDELEEIKDNVEKIKNIDLNYVVDPISTNQKGVYELKDITSVGITTIFPIIALFVLLMLVSTNIILDKKIHFIERLNASKTNRITYLIEKLLFFFLITLVQFLVVFLVFLIAGTSFSLNFLGLLQILLFVALVDTLLGILIGLFSESEGVAMLISLLLTLPFMFLSGIFYPLKLMPKAFQFFSYLSPLNFQVSLMKQAVLFGQAINWEYFYIPLGLFLVCYIYLRRK